MNKPKVFLAVAGAGKTYSICNTLDVNKRNIIITFTHENVFNIINELIKRIGYIPDNVVVTTFDTFLLSNFIWPYYTHIQSELFKKPPTLKKGVSLTKTRFDPKNIRAQSKTNYHHYFVDSSQNRYLKLDTVSDMIIEKRLLFKNGKTLFEIGIERLKRFFDYIFIDEFQDYRQSDYKLITSIALAFKNCLFYGDYYQHSVSGQNNSGEPFLEKRGYEAFIKHLLKQGFEVDITTLSKTRRCSCDVCDFIRENMEISIFHDEQMNRLGIIRYVFDPVQLREISISEKPVIISLDSNKQWNSVSFGISKGSTYASTIVVFPDKILKKDSTKELKMIKNINSQITRNKVYVGLTRSSGNVYITNKATMDKMHGID